MAPIASIFEQSILAVFALQTRNALLAHAVRSVATQKAGQRDVFDVTLLATAPNATIIAIFLQGSVVQH